MKTALLMIPMLMMSVAAERKPGARAPAAAADHAPSVPVSPPVRWWRRWWRKTKIQPGR